MHALMHAQTHTCSCQVARYEQGQHFLSHEDAFPVPLVRANGFQRHATALLYLNTVEQVGEGGGRGKDQKHLGCCNALRLWHSLS